MIELLNCDNMDYMRGLPDGAFELAIVDPPYGINAPIMSPTPTPTPTQRNRLQRLNGGGGKLKNRILNKSIINWDSAIPTPEYFTELRRVSKNQIIWGGNYFDLPPTRGIICWDKVQPWPNFSAWEMAWTSFDCVARIFKFDNRTGGKIHPTEKPISLYEWLLATYAKPDDRILDTHGGSMSIAIACHNLGFNLTLCELDEGYYKDGVARLEQHKAQASLFDPVQDSNPVQDNMFA